MAKNQGDPLGKGQAMRDKIAESQRTERRRNRHKGEYADYVNVSAHALHKAIVQLTASNCAIQFGYTKDGSTFVVRVVGDGEPYNEFIRPSEDMDAYLNALAADYNKAE